MTGVGEARDRPVLVVMVHNQITGDSRVIKTALAAARGGWDVTLIGWARDRKRRETRLGEVRVLRVPLVRTLHSRFEAVERAAAAPPAPRSAEAVRSLDRVARGIPVRAVSARASRALTRLADRLTPPAPSPSGPIRPRVSPEDIVWRRDWPVLDDWWLSYRPELRRLRPDVIHANDVQMMGVAARYAEDVRLRGGSCAWVYDSHEFVPAVDWGGEAVSAAFRQHEGEFIGRADAVVTVSEGIAHLIRERHGLREVPDVVRNTPVADVGDPPQQLRTVCGLADDVPLLVYSGRVARARGVHTVVDALPDLPGVHLAVVCSGTGADLDELRSRAVELGVIDRLHVAPYVDATHVPAYLSSADIGLAPFLRRPNHEESLPTKVPEYLHARLPIVASDMRTMAAFLADTGTGVSFKAESVPGCVAAVTDALARRAELRAAITDDLLAEHSWQRQADVLVDRYAVVSGLRPTPRDLPWAVVEEPVLGPGAPAASH